MTQNQQPDKINPEIQFHQVNIRDQEGVLEISRRKGNGCACAFIFLWLIGWTYGTVGIIIQEVSAQRPVGMAALIMIGVWLLFVLFLVWHWTGRESLHVNREHLRYRLSAIITLRKRACPSGDVRGVDLYKKQEQSDKEYGLEVATKHWMIRCFAGVEANELCRICEMIHRHLPLETRHDVEEPVVAIDVAANPVPATSADEESESLLGKIGFWLSFGVLLVFTIIWNAAVLSQFIKTIIEGPWHFLIVLIPFAAIGLYLAFLSILGIYGLILKVSNFLSRVLRNGGRSK